MTKTLNSQTPNNELQVLEARAVELASAVSDVGQQREAAQRALDGGDTSGLDGLVALQTKHDALATSQTRVQTAIVDKRAAIAAASVQQQRERDLARVAELSQVAQDEATAMQDAFADLAAKFDEVVSQRLLLWNRETARRREGLELQTRLATSQPFPFMSGLGLLGHGSPLLALVTQAVQERERQASLQQLDRARTEHQARAHAPARPQVEAQVLAPPEPKKT